MSKGDQALALFLTVVSNLLGILTVPPLLGLYLSSSPVTNVTIDVWSLCFKLTLTVLIPSLIGMGLRNGFLYIMKLVNTYKVYLSLFSTFNLVMIVWMALSNSQALLLQQSFLDILIIIGIAVAMHLFYLFANSIMVSKRFLNFSLRQSIAVVIMASQKSSPVALAIITNLQLSSDQKGFFAIPCIIGQLSQIFIGSLLARRFAKQVESSENAVHPVPTSDPITNDEQAAIDDVEPTLTAHPTPSNISLTIDVIPSNDQHDHN